MTKSLPPKILAQPMNVVSPVPPPTMPLGNINGKPKLTMIELDTSVKHIGQAQSELLLYPNGHPPLFD